MQQNKTKQEHRKTDRLTTRRRKNTVKDFKNEKERKKKFLYLHPTAYRMRHQPFECYRQRRE